MTAVCSSSPKGVYRGVDRRQHTVAQGSQTYGILVIVKICCGFFRTGFHSSYRRQNCGFLLRDLGVTLLIIMGGEGAVYWVAVVRGDWFSTPPEGCILTSLFTIPMSPHTELHVCTSCCSEWATIAQLHFPFNLLIQGAAEKHDGFQSEITQWGSTFLCKSYYWKAHYMPF
jgi:hypothetical protein